ncbi:GTPase-associated system all-helical protein GASH [Nocardioides sp. NPDC057767]|uniref:GTPase-associated system all-helical protein GASH n=1 Tax=unclassified Nocardioides TaxID=2615069 RepID=UPI00366E814A
MDLIGELLHRRLLTEIGDEEERLRMVRDAALALSQRFKSDLRSLVPHAVVAAVDEDCGADTDPLTQAYGELTAQWETVRNAFDGPPLSLIRAITLEAVAAVAEDDSRVLAAAWYSLRTALEELPAGSWAEPLGDLAKRWDDAIWESVEASWSPVSVSSKVTMPPVSKFDNDRITASTAATARKEAATFVASGNWQNFAQTMMTGYPDHVEALVSASEVAAAEALRQSNEDLRTFAGELGKKLRDILAAQEDAIESTRLRGELLWWQRTAFSPTRRVGYSDLEPAEVPVVAAYDLHLLMPEVAPLAAEHLLSGVVARASGNAKVSIDDLSGAADNLPAGNGHTPTLVLDAAQSDAKTQLLARGEDVEAGRAAVLLFRDLQARRLSGTGDDES